MRFLHLAPHLALLGAAGCVHPDPGPPRASFSTELMLEDTRPEACSFSMHGGSNLVLFATGQFYVEVAAEATPPGDATICAAGDGDGDGPLPNCGGMSSSIPESTFVTPVRLEGPRSPCRRDIPLAAFAFDSDRLVVRADVQVIVAGADGAVELETDCPEASAP
jgi:hypothetical protein